MSVNVVLILVGVTTMIAIEIVIAIAIMARRKQVSKKEQYTIGEMNKMVEPNFRVMRREGGGKLAVRDYQEGFARTIFVQEEEFLSRFPDKNRF